MSTVQEQAMVDISGLDPAFQEEIQIKLRQAEAEVAKANEETRLKNLAEWAQQWAERHVDDDGLYIHCYEGLVGYYILQNQSEVEDRYQDDLAIDWTVPLRTEDVQKLLDPNLTELEKYEVYRKRFLWLNAREPGPFTDDDDKRLYERLYEEDGVRLYPDELHDKWCSETFHVDYGFKMFVDHMKVEYDIEIEHSAWYSRRRG